MSRRGLGRYEVAEIQDGFRTGRMRGAVSMGHSQELLKRIQSQMVGQYPNANTATSWRNHCICPIEESAGYQIFDAKDRLVSVVGIGGYSQGPPEGLAPKHDPAAVTQLDAFR